MEVGIWVLFVVLLVPAGFVGWGIGHETGHGSATKTVTVGSTTRPGSTPSTLALAPAFTLSQLAAQPQDDWVTNGGPRPNHRSPPPRAIHTPHAPKRKDGRVT